jgi:hypothetical protein
LILAVSFPLLGRTRDFHHLERAPAGRTVTNPHLKMGVIDINIKINLFTENQIPFCYC